MLKLQYGHHKSNTVCFSTGAASAANAVSTTCRRQARSCSGSFAGSPTGCGMRPARKMRLAPTACATEVMAVITTAGSPARSCLRRLRGPATIRRPRQGTLPSPGSPSPPAAKCGPRRRCPAGRAGRERCARAPPLCSAAQSRRGCERSALRRRDGQYQCQPRQWRDRRSAGRGADPG